MDDGQLIGELERYERELAAILGRFSREFHIAPGDDPKFRQYVRELVDLFNDALGRNPYSRQIADEANQGVSNDLNSPSYKSIFSFTPAGAPRVSSKNSKANRIETGERCGGIRRFVRWKSNMTVLLGRQHAGHPRLFDRF